MALNSRPSLDPRWSYHNRSVAKSFMNSVVSIYHQGLAGTEYNAVTGEWTSAASVIWSGKARIQPVSTAKDVAVMTNDSAIKKVRIQIDFAGNTVVGSNGQMVDIRPGDYLLVTSSPTDPLLANFIYVVQDVLNSSSPWQRTLMCEVNLEADPNG